MSKIGIIDTTGKNYSSLKDILEKAGYETSLQEALSCCDMSLEAIILVADASGLAQAFANVAAFRERHQTPVILIAELDRSGWDRTFSASEGLAVDALLEQPVPPEALIQRLHALLEARQAAQKAMASPQMDYILQRAIANEQAAAEFYARAAALVAAPATKEILQTLAQEERTHEKLLEEFRAGKRPLPDAQLAPENSGAIIEATLSLPDFSPEMQPLDAFLLAAKKEKLSAAAYENWARLYPEGPERQLLFQLAQMEREHQHFVESMLVNASFPEAWE